MYYDACLIVVSKSEVQVTLVSYSEITSCAVNPYILQHSLLRGNSLYADRSIIWTDSTVQLWSWTTTLAMQVCMFVVCVWETAFEEGWRRMIQALLPDIMK